MKKWVCTVCGYVYEGEAAPEVCPVCKAPASKFKEQEGETLTRSMTLFMRWQKTRQDMAVHLRVC